MRNAAKRNFHLPLPNELYFRLRAEAKQSNKPATQLAREAIEFWLRRRRKLARHKAIAGYAAAFAGTKADLDRELEAAALQHWLHEEELSR